MQRNPPSRSSDVLLFAGIAVSIALAVHAVGLFRPPVPGESALDRLEELGGLAATLLSGVSEGSPLPTRSREDPRIAGRTHRVQKGEVLSEIAARYQVPIDEIVGRNDLEDPDRLEVGQRLVVGREGPRSVPDVAAGPGSGWLALVRGLFAGGGQTEDGGLDASLAPVEKLLEMADQDIRAARFEAALHTTQVAERLLDDLAPDITGPPRPRLELTRATALVAFGRELEARRSLERVLEADPAFELDPASTPRKLRRLLEAVRNERPPG